MATELVLIRHGNAVQVNGDYVHAPLTPLGQEQAAQTGQFLAQPAQHLDGLYSSPVRRTRETADIIGSSIGTSPTLQNGIRELEGLEVPTLAFYEILSALDLVEDYLDAHVGKPMRWPIQGRVSTALTEILPKYPNQRLAVVTHSGVISSVLAWYFPEQRLQWWLNTVGNCSLTRLQVEGTQAKLLAVNEIQHLSPAVVTTQPPARTVRVAKKVQQAVKKSDSASVPKKE